MPGWLKVILVIVLMAIALVVGVGFIGFRWIQRHAPEIRAQGDKVRADAAAFGKDKTPDACVDEAFARLDRCDGVVCQAMTKIFLTRCVAASNVPDGFCARIPSRHHLIDTMKWSLAECARRGRRSSQQCTQMITGLQDYCDRR